MVSIRKFNLSNNQITKFPTKNIDVLSSLHDLDLSFNEINEFPAEFENLRLEVVNMTNNKVLEIPGTIRNVSSIFGYRK